MKEIMEKWRLVMEEARIEDEELELLDSRADDELAVDIAQSGSADAHGGAPELDEWEADKDSEYPSRKRTRDSKYLLKPDRGSWVPAADDLARGGLTKGYVGMKEAKKKPRKKQCHATTHFTVEMGSL